jgi:hypothetical protein
MILLAILLASSLVQAESIPLIHESGTYQVPVLINDKISLNFTVDSGAADVSIPADVFSTLSRTGTITKNDLMDKQVYELADGSERRSQRFRIRSLRVGNLDSTTWLARWLLPPAHCYSGRVSLSDLTIGVSIINDTY